MTTAILAAIPRNPVTLLLNDYIMDSTLKTFAEKNLPAYELIITSESRTEAEQEDLKAKGYTPSENSAHLYHLARDFVLKNKATGQMVAASKLESIWKDFIKPNWVGYTYFAPAKSGVKGAHIHVNLDRSISDSTKLIGWATIGLTTFLTVKKILSRGKQ